jgi:SAM-dependent methyltransferase
VERSIYEQMRTLERDHWWFAARREVLAAVIARLRLPKSARILEVGCGTGGNLPMLKRFGDVTAVEPDAESRVYAHAQTGVTVLHGLLPDALPAFDEGFDLIASLDVIEHVDDDAAALAALGGLLAPGGRLLTTVPAYPWMWTTHDEHHHHKRRYTRAGYRARLEAAGLTVTRATYFNTLLFPPIAAIRGARLLAGKRDGGDDAAPVAAPLNAALKSVFGAERHLLRALDLPFGVSILTVSERRA